MKISLPVFRYHSIQFFHRHGSLRKLYSSLPSHPNNHPGPMTDHVILQYRRLYMDLVNVYIFIMKKYFNVTFDINKFYRIL